MSDSGCECGARGCPEYAMLSRRQFMHTSVTAAALAAAAPAWLPRVSVARDYRASQRDVVISLFLRGASDGLSLVPPHGENLYYTNRPTQAIPRPDSGQANRAIDLDGFFGFAAPFAPLIPAYQAGKLLVVHATGSTDPSRSHFDAQRFMEVGEANSVSMNTGWLGRHLMSVAPMDQSAILRAVGISSGLQRTLVGAPDALPIPNLDAFGLAGSVGTIPARSATIGTMYDAVTDPVRAAGLTTLSTIDLLNQIDFAGYIPAGGAVYPDATLGLAFKSTAALVKAQVGVAAIAIDASGWDTHNAQGTLTGTLSGLMGTLASALAAFYTDVIDGGGPSVTVVCMSEFGRRLEENGSGGTDHGHGNCMLVMGNCVAGGRVLSQWPGLAPDQLFQGLDLQVTIDYRDILAEIVQNRLGNTNLANVFPSYSPTFRGVTSC